MPTNSPNRRIVQIAMQSNGRGHLSHPLDGRYGWRQACRYGPPVFDPIGPRGSTIPTNHLDYAGSIWPCLAEELYRRGAGWNQFRNTAVGSTGMITDWWGFPSSVLATAGGAGWDPNSYIADAISELNSGIHDERWVFIGEGSNDASADHSLANMTSVYQLLANYALDNGADGVILCLSSHTNNGSNDNWMEEVGSVARTAALAALASDSRVHAGWDLAGTYGNSWGYHDVVDDTSSAIDWTSSSHWDLAGYEICINEALEALGPDGAGWYTTPHTHWSFAGSGRFPPNL